MQQINQKTIGFVIGEKENEKRRAILPEDIIKVRNKEALYFEEHYGEVLNIPDEAYRTLGCHIVPRAIALKKDIICEPKIGDANYLSQLTEAQTIFGWIHAGENKQRNRLLLNRKVTAYEWANMMADNRHCFWKNNILAGEAAVLHAYQCIGILPNRTKVAVIGRGNSAQGAIAALTKLGAEVVIYNRKQEALLRKELPEYDVLVNAILWDNHRKDHIIYKEDLARMKKGALIIDVSCDENGGIESSIPTTIETPTYVVAGIVHYVVDHTPSILYQAATHSISQEICKYLDDLIETKENIVLEQALITKAGVQMNA